MRGAISAAACSRRANKRASPRARERLAENWIISKQKNDWYSVRCGFGERSLEIRFGFFGGGIERGLLVEWTKKVTETKK